MFLFKIFDDGNPSSLSTLLQAKDADCTRARRDDCCKVLVFNSVGNVFYDLLSISGMPPPHLATNSHILSLVPIPKHSSTEQQAVLSSMTRAVFQDHKVPLGRCSQLELLSCHSLITTVVKQDHCWALSRQWVVHSDFFLKITVPNTFRHISDLDQLNRLASIKNL